MTGDAKPGAIVETRAYDDAGGCKRLLRRDQTWRSRRRPRLLALPGSTASFSPRSPRSAAAASARRCGRQWTAGSIISSNFASSAAFNRNCSFRKPFGPKEVETMSQTVSPSTSRCYGLARVSRAWSVSRAGVYRFLKRTPSPAIARRRGPTGPCRDADLADHIRREIEASDFHGEFYENVRRGARSSPRRVRRVMGENGLLAPHRVGRNQRRRTTEPSSPTRSMKCGERT